LNIPKHQHYLHSCSQTRNSRILHPSRLRTRSEKQGRRSRQNRFSLVNPETKQKILATTGGVVSKIENGIIYVSDTEAQTLEYVIPFGRKTTVQKGDLVQKGDKLCEGNIDVEELMTVAGPAKAQQYIVAAVKEIYASQGQTVNAKHVSCIVRQMFSKVTIIEPGEVRILPGRYD
jgi:DNA-directed RNA polymerase subunit beta'